MFGSAFKSEIEPSGFFVIRTPLLPFEEIERLGEDLATQAISLELENDTVLVSALAADRARLRNKLRDLIERPEIREALFVASPALENVLEAWKLDPDGKKGRRAEEALVRYVMRMAARPTPFGLFAGCALGVCGSRSRLRLAARGAYRRHTRLDADYLFALTEDLGRAPELRRLLRYRPNSSLYKAAGRFRYIEGRLQDRARSHHLVAVEAAGYLEKTLERAQAGATVEELAEALAEDEPGEDVLDEAREFVHELIDRQILVSRLSPLVTGSEPIHDLIEQLGHHPASAPVARELAAVRDSLDALDARGLGACPEEYRAIARRLEEAPQIPTQAELPRLFQVDLVKPATEATLGPDLLADIERGIEILRRLMDPVREDSLSRFRQEFLERYEGTREVPLVEVLDEEVGLGFDRSRASSAEASPLLQGFSFPPPPGDPAVPWAPRLGLIFRKLEEALLRGDRQIELRDEEIAALPAPEPGALPDSFHVVAAVAAASEAALHQGDFQISLVNVFGPSGARLLGRFCHADERLRELVEGHLRQEEALEPEAIFAEVVHLPEGRVGNVLARPVLRRYEIPYLGRSGAPAKRQIPVTDLLVSVAGQEIILRSASLGRRVIPRLTTAHSLHPRNLSLYRFLGMLQGQGVQGGLGWDWGPFEIASFLPRVTCGRLVLARARWRVSGNEVAPLAEKKSEAGRFRAFREWRTRRGIPRWALLADSDNELPVDFDNVLSLNAFLALAGKRPDLRLVEMFPCPESLIVTGPEGRFTHELVIPFVRRRPPGQYRSRPALEDESVCRIFPPGSEWLYAKLYTGTATADRVLNEVIGPVAREAIASGAADRWFFVRYGDPRWHLRVRFHGDPRGLQQHVLPRLQAAASSLLAQGCIWKLQLDTYERETERYGGPAGIALSESLFHIDSETALAILDGLEGDEGADARWLLALYGSDRLLSDLGLEGEDKRALLHSMKENLARQLHAGADLRRQMAERLRVERSRLSALLGPEPPDDPSLTQGLAAFEARSRRLAPEVAELRKREAAGRLTSSLADLASSFCHMFNNRLLRSEGPAHELILYDFLLRLHRSQIARSRET